MTTGEYRKMVEMWRDGAKLKDIADELGYSRTYLNHVIIKNRQDFPYRCKKVDPKKRDLWMTRLWAGRVTRREVADACGCSISAVNKWYEEGRGR